MTHTLSPISVNENDLGIWFANDDQIQLCLAVIDLAAIYGLDTADLWVRTCESPIHSIMFVESLTQALANTPWLAIHNALSVKNYPEFDIHEFICSMGQDAIDYLNHLLPENHTFDFYYDEKSGVVYFGLFRIGN